MLTKDEVVVTNTTELISIVATPNGGTANDLAVTDFEEAVYDHYIVRDTESSVDKNLVQARIDELAKYIDLYYERGWCVVPAPPTYDHDLGGYVVNKGPRTKGWSATRLTSHEVIAKLVGYCHGLPENIVIPTGAVSGNLIGIDLDSVEAWGAWCVIESEKRLTTKMVRRRASAPQRGQKFYQVETPMAVRRYTHPGGGADTMHVELLGDGACAMAPPSTHPKTKDAVYWEGEMPDSLVPTQVKAADLAFAVKLCATAAMFGRKWEKIEGKHGQTTLALMGVLARNAEVFAKADAILLVKAIVAAGGDKLHKRLKAVEDTYDNLAAGLPTTGLPKLVELVGQDVVTSLCNWWGIKDCTEKIENPSSSLTASAPPAAQASSETKAIPWLPSDMRIWLTTAPPAPEWLFEGVMVRGIVAGLAAAGGTGKSILMLELAISAAIGRALLKSLTPRGPLKVLIFLGEDPEEVTWRRFKAISDWADLSKEEELLLSANLKVYPYSAEPLLVVKDNKAVETPRYGWMQVEMERQKPDLVIIDPKSRWFAGDENSNDHATRFVTMLEKLIRPCRASMIVTHHVNKSRLDGGSPSTSRGASAFPDATRLFFSMGRAKAARHIGLKAEDHTKCELLLSITKSNYSATTPQPIRLCQLLSKNGIIEEATEPMDKLDSIVIAIALELRARGPMNRSAIIDPRGEEGKDFLAALRERVTSNKLERKQAVESALKHGFFVEFEEKTGGRAASKIWLASEVAKESKDIDTLDESDDDDRYDDGLSGDSSQDYIQEAEWNFVE